MKNDVLVGTYHKTGTVWMSKVLSKMSSDLPVLYQNLSYDVLGCKNERDAKLAFAGVRTSAREKGLYALLFDDHTRFPDAKLLSGCVGFRVVRDPRDVVISSVNYHCNSDEKWLHIPRKEFGGKTYSEKIGSLSVFDDKIQFEIEHSAGSNIRRMAMFQIDEIFETVKYEDLVVDVSLQFWLGLMTRLGLDAAEVDMACQAFWDLSIFGGLKGKKTVHVLDGGVEQWKTKLSDNSRQLIEEAFAHEIDALGYKR